MPFVRLRIVLPLSAWHKDYFWRPTGDCLTEIPAPHTAWLTSCPEAVYSAQANEPCIPMVIFITQPGIKFAGTFYQFKNEML